MTLTATRVSQSGAVKLRPVLVFAGIGAAMLAFEIYVMARWVLGPNFTAVPSGPSSPPTWMKTSLIGLNIILAVAAVIVLWRVVIRPWVRDGRPSANGLVCLVYSILWFEDPLSNYFQVWFTYTTYLPNRGSWACDIPGWVSQCAPGHQLAFPVLFFLPVYIVIMFGGIYLVSEAMKKVAQRRPQIRRSTLVFGTLLACMVFDYIIEGVTLMRLGLYSYSGGIAAINGSSYFKFPIAQAILWGATWTGMSCLLAFRDDRGLTIVERGIDSLWSAPRTALVRFLALFAGINLCFLLLYQVPSALVTAKSSTWPADLQQRSYLTSYVCGAGTTYACPGPGIPMPRPGSVHIAPDGSLVDANGKVLAPSVAPRSLQPFKGCPTGTADPLCAP